MSSSSRSQASLSDACMSTSGSKMGTKPLAKTRLAMSNCCCTTALMPCWSKCLIIERPLVPKMPAAMPRSNTSSNAGIS
eukprot:CAMPEP_0177348942 /NCGR_PEP_ID=MMETSP0368-20130122/30534_1 /TAXON_ID=447022 ORGANISM="Scrippsiella hangoei-like, Strain SHHI-4" /NCGR_SAMPLE_ID=MMETSP0368 /ASSEMBLY_ACC=CAM_ASM_000363 /LENGTH=78 /DNA_ID=CAMNT_0018810787 /DNA_START=67 /DNA_END=300 /DNA_ORIENTATION=-